MIFCTQPALNNFYSKTKTDKLNQILYTGDLLLIILLHLILIILLVNQKFKL
jgi:hypothetical protein